MGFWLQACKEYATKVGRWTVPKKDTPEYAEVKKIMDRMAAAAPAPEAKAAAPVKAAVEAAPAKKRAEPKLKAPESHKKAPVVVSEEKPEPEVVVKAEKKRGPAKLKTVEEEPSVVEAVMPPAKKGRSKAAKSAGASLVAERAVVSFQ